MTAESVTLLLIEDNDLDVMAFRRGMKKHGLGNPLVVAADGREALRLLRGDAETPPLAAPLVIFLDLNMPVMSGVEFLDAIRDDEPSAGRSIYVLTSSEQDVALWQRHADQISGYLPKSELIDACMKAIDSAT